MALAISWSAALITVLCFVDLVQLGSVTATGNEVSRIVERDATCDSSSNPLCVSKCCEDGLEFDEDFECVTSNNSLWSPETFLGSREDVDISKLQYVYGWPTGCNESDLIMHESGPYYLLQDGTMYSENGSQSELTPSYCLDIFYDEVVGVYCTPSEEPEEEKCDDHQFLYPILMKISSFCLILTLVVYAGVPKLRQKTYGRCFMSLITTILMFYITSIHNYDHSVTHDVYQCITSAFFMYVNNLAIFFWLNVMGFELWRTFCWPATVKQLSRKKFIKYSLYAWGCPFLMGCIAIGIDNLPQNYVSLPPNFSACYLAGKLVNWAYFYWVIIAVNYINLCFFIHMCYKMCKMKNVSIKRMGSFWMFLKMFLIIGIPWTLEIFSTNECIWMYGDMFNLLQGTFIFIATCCTRTVFKEVKDWLSPKISGQCNTCLQLCQKNPTSGEECGDEHPRHSIKVTNSNGQDNSVTNNLDNIESSMPMLPSNAANNFQPQDNIDDTHDGQLSPHDDQLEMAENTNPLKREMTIREKAKQIRNLVKYIPLIIACVTVCTVVLDVYTDAKSTERICTSLCSCIKKVTIDGEGNHKTSFEKPDDQTCFNAIVPDTNMTGEDFCLNFKDNSTSITWPPQGNHRHPWWCTISITTIVLSSVINNAFLMFRLISYYGLYCKILGLSCLAETENSSAKYAVRTVIFLLFCIQLLPVTWLCLLVYSEYLNLDGNRKGMRERQKLLFTTVAFKMFFTVTEDIPQLFLQILFLYRALTGLEEGMDNALSLTAILGITMSCLNGAWSSRFGIEDKPSRVAAALVTTITLFSRVGVITIRSGFVLYILVPALMLYELTNWNIKNTDMDVPDIFRKEQADIDITHGDNAENDVTNNRSSFIERLRDYSWRCIDGLLFDGTSVRGVFVTIMYLFISLFMLMVDKEKFHIYQWFSIMLSINLFAIFNYTPIEANMNKR